MEHLSWSQLREILPIKEDKAQIEFYMHGIDSSLRKTFHNKTIGIIISKKQNEFIVSFVGSDSIFPLTYMLEREKV